MSRKKQTEMPETSKLITLTKEQYEKLQEISGQISQAKRYIDNIGDDSDYQDRQVGFEAGKAYITLDMAEDVLDDILNDIDPEDGEYNEDDY